MTVFTLMKELVFDPLERLLVVHAPGGLAEVADDEAHRVGHDQRELTEDPRVTNSKRIGSSIDSRGRRR